MKSAVYLCPALLLLAPTAAHAGEVFGGLYVHDVKLPTDKSGIEDGADVQLGYRGGDIGHTPLQPYIFGALNTAGQTSYAAAGLSARFGRTVYFRPGLGIARGVAASRPLRAGVRAIHRSLPRALHGDRAARATRLLPGHLLAQPHVQPQHASAGPRAQLQTRLAARQHMADRGIIPYR